MERDLCSIDITPIKTMFAMLESEYTLRDMVDALEAGDVQMYDSFGRLIAPRTEDVKDIREALLEYARFDDERTRAGAAQSDRCLEYFNSFKSFIAGTYASYQSVPILGRTWINNPEQGEKGFGTPATDIGRALALGGSPSRIRVMEIALVKELAEPIILRGTLKHNAIADHLLKMTGPDGNPVFTKLKRNPMIRVLKELCRSMGREHLVKSTPNTKKIRDQ